MAARSARSPRNRRQVEDFDDDNGLGDFLIRHRYAVGGMTAFAVAFAYVTANAIWYQPHSHGSAFFATRPMAPAAQPASGEQGRVASGDVETVIRIERAHQQEQVSLPSAPAIALDEIRQPAEPAAPEPAAEAPAVAGDAVVAEVQRVLADLNLYTGDVDGLTGPQTRTAIENYRRIVGIGASGEIDDQLLAQLGASGRPVQTSEAPAQRPAQVQPPAPVQPPAQVSQAPVPRNAPVMDMIQTSSAPSAEGDAMIQRIQAGLKAFGNDGIEIDGVVGPRTKAAIIEFQSLFGLPETGEASRETLAKMREIGLTD